MKLFPVIVTFLLFISGCAALLGDLRKDLDDTDSSAQSAEASPSEATVGGVWSERGYLNKEEGSIDRRPSTIGQHQRPQDDSWVSEEDLASNRRASFRGRQNDSQDSWADHPSVSTSNLTNLEPDKKRLYKKGPRATKDDFVDQSQEEGSLWASSGQTNYYFTKNKIRSPGDLVTVVVEPELYRDIGIEVKRTLLPIEKDMELAVVQKKMRTKFLADLEGTRKDNLTSSAASPERTPASPTAAVASDKVDAQPSPGPSPSAQPLESSVGPAVQSEEIERLVPRASLSDVDISQSLDFKPTETMMGEIVERYPNGNYKIRTMKRIPYKKGPPRLVSVIGIVKSNDINEETDVINSGKIYAYRVEVSR